MMKHFPDYRLCFTPEAQCRTNAPDKWSVLLSQRRRWINSTVHNLFELIYLPQLCGFCCFSMRFIVFLDLFSTVVQPAALVYIGYLVYSLVDDANNKRDNIFPWVSVCMIAGVYGLQVIIFLIKRQWGQIIWMLLVRLLSFVISDLLGSIYSPCPSLRSIFLCTRSGTLMISLGVTRVLSLVTAARRLFIPQTSSL